MTGRLRDQIDSDDPVVAAAARHLRSAPALPDLDRMQARVAAALAARPAGAAGAGALARLAFTAAAACAVGAVTLWLAYRPADGPSTEERPPRAAADAAARRPAPPPPRFPGAASSPLAPVALVPETLLWAAGHEGGDLAEWKGRGPFTGRLWAMPGTEGGPAAAAAYRGGWGLRFAADGDGQDRSVGTELVGPMPDEGYYSAWLYVPERHRVHDFWGVMGFKTRSDPADRRSRFSVVTVNLGNRSDGEMVLYLWDHVQRRSVEAPQPRAVPIGAWFHLEVRLARFQDGRTEIEVWQDGVSVLAASDLSIAEPFVHWSVGITVGRLTPERVVLFADDLALSRVRLGPWAPATLFEPPGRE